MLKNLEGHSNFVSSVSFSPNGNSIVSGSNDKTIKIWGNFSGSLLKTLEGHSNGVNQISISADGTLIISALKDKTITLWEFT